MLGAAGVLLFKPTTQEFNLLDLRVWQVGAIAASISLTVVCWGWYGSVLHKGQALMGGSRLRPGTTAGGLDSAVDGCKTSIGRPFTAEGREYS